MVQIEYPQFITPEKYDHYLERGWFRSSFMMYKSEILCINNGLSSIVNIRVDLKDYEIKKRHKKLLRRNDSLFEVNLCPLNIHNEAERLYQQQKQKFQGFIHSTLKDYLFANMEVVPYNTKQIEVRHEGRLIAMSIVDLGLNSIASILGLYDLKAKQFSLGKYTMLKELEFAKNTGIKWYYPGYILDQESSFNYKLNFAPCEYLNEEGEWVPFELFKSELCKAHEIREKTKEIELFLDKKGIDHKKWYYPYFSFGFLAHNSEGLFLNKALFIELRDNGNYKLILSWDIQSKCYILELIWPFAEPERFMNIDPSSEYLADDNCYMTLSESELINSGRNLELLVRNIDS